MYTTSAKRFLPPALYKSWIPVLIKTNSYTTSTGPVKSSRVQIWLKQEGKEALLRDRNTCVRISKVSVYSYPLHSSWDRMVRGNKHILCECLSQAFWLIQFALGCHERPVGKINQHNSAFNETISNGRDLITRSPQRNVVWSHSLISATP